MAAVEHDVSPAKLEEVQEHLAHLISGVDEVRSGLRAIANERSDELEAGLMGIDWQTSAPGLEPEAVGHLLFFAGDVETAIASLSADLQEIRNLTHGLYLEAREAA
jgi:hypothetical protein